MENYILVFVIILAIYISFKVGKNKGKEATKDWICEQPAEKEIIRTEGRMESTYKVTSIRTRRVLIVEQGSGPIFLGD